MRSVLRKEISPDWIANKIVVFGSAAKGIGDAAPSRLYSNLNGVEIHVQAIEGMILEKLLNRPGYFQVVELFVLLVVGLVLIVVVPIMSVRLATSVIVLTAALWGATSWYPFKAHLLLFDVSYGIFGLILFLFITVGGTAFWTDKKSAPPSTGKPVNG